jgi:chromosome segregation ATPase
MTELSRAKRAQDQLSRHLNELRRRLGACEQRLKEAKAKIRDINDQLLIAHQAYLMSRFILSQTISFSTLLETAKSQPTTGFIQPRR